MENESKSNKGPHRRPMIDFADAVNRSMVGDLGALSKGGCWSTIMMVPVVIVVIFLLSKCSS
ncbi:hypothetical protein HMPREF1210_00490 [Paenisporosarcina sp. HGH0030]|uniref:hypothetical protein n=1 Tax=Paenisporosarcina sp. HGH0030 TaxID=1078085 RepID=UPI00034E2F0E|nr:hypothetical protein [Paenisporosarcina sp. HGH0030]EPD53667.1 hypothetical protein HMPREF1210_00490 [Paenisporosarcina sp. HGH0030]